MKFRNDFVTNSSSSSYVIAYKNTLEIDDETLKKYPVLKAYQRLIEGIINCEGYETSIAEIMTTKEEYDKYFKDIYGWRKISNIQDILDDEPGLAELYNKTIDYLNHGYSIMCKNVGYGDEGLSALIKCIAENNENFVILEDE